MCIAEAPLSAAAQDRLLRFSALIKRELAALDAPAAIVARAGLDLRRFGFRYSHAGVSLRDSANADWSVRQLYFDCDSARPRLFDQGLPGFVMGGNNPSLGFVSIVRLSSASAERLSRMALNDAKALSLLGDAYSANAYAFSARYQNCNQWVLEMLTAVWADLFETSTGDLRERAQRWLAASNYQPSRFIVANPFLMLLGQFVPWLHDRDHPRRQLLDGHYLVTTPESIEAIVQRLDSEARRIELCLNDRQMVVHHGWDPIADGCNAAPADRVIEFD